jgi:hypothetical protein
MTFDILVENYKCDGFKSPASSCSLATAIFSLATARTKTKTVPGYGNNYFVTEIDGCTDHIISRKESLEVGCRLS